MDVSSFYASYESTFRPDLEGKPIVILLNNDSCIIASSAEAKVLGINIGAPYFKQKDLFRRRGVFRFSSNYELYVGMSSKVMSILEELSLRVEVYSIDKAFCDLTGMRDCKDLTDFDREIRETILQKARLTVGVGVVQTRTLAKLANYVTEKWQEQTSGVVDLSNTKHQRKLVAALPVDGVQGARHRISKKLDIMGTKTVCSLVDTDIRFIHKHFDVVLRRIVRELRNEPCLTLEELASVKQGIICPGSLGEKLTDYNAVKEAICIYAARAAEKLRREHQFCQLISTSIRINPFSLNEPYYGNSASIKLLTPTQDSREIIRVATRSPDAVQREGQHYQKTRVMLSNFFSSGIAQLNLFGDNVPQHNNDKLMVVLDILNVEKDKGTFYFAGQGI